MKKADKTPNKKGVKKNAVKAAAKRVAKPAKKSASKPEAAKSNRAIATKRAPTRRPRAKSADLEQLGELPARYGETRLFAVARDPHVIFCYWDPSISHGSPVFLRCTRAGTQTPETEVEVSAAAGNAYVPAAHAGAEYEVEVGCYAGRRWKPLAGTRGILTPAEVVAPEVDPIPPIGRMEFRQTVEKLRARMREGETLAQMLTRLDKSGELARGDFAPGELLALGALVPTSFGSLNSGELGRCLSSPGMTPSGFAPSSWGSSSGLLAQFGLAGGSSWDSAFRETAGSSWGGLSSGNVAWSAALSSWGAASSWPTSGPGSSWSTQPIGRAVPRDFFMHLNAEVIFYGGTHPDAKLTVGGKEIPLRPDGTFRFHFVFPDSEYEIPVVAISPDGKETRRAALRFERSTSREGDVGATAQPPLGEPTGKK